MENCSIFDFLLKQTDPKDCLHIHQNFLFLFDLLSIVEFLERFDQTNNHILIETLHQQIQASTQPQFWNNVYV